jgi:hypothetical protein
VLPGDEASTPICQAYALLGQMCQAKTVTDAPIIVITAYGDPITQRLQKDLGLLYGVAAI